MQKELTIRGHLICNHPDDFAAAIKRLELGGMLPLGLHEPVSPYAAVRDILSARNLAGKTWIEFGNWDA